MLSAVDVICAVSSESLPKVFLPVSVTHVCLADTAADLLDVECRRSDVALQWDSQQQTCNTVGPAQRSTSDGGSNVSDHSDDDGDEYLLHSHVLSREQLMGVTAMACDGPRLLTGNAEGRVLFQDFTGAISHDAETQVPDAQRHGAARPAGRDAGSSRFWYRPR
jgi:hypothetical protein